MQESNLAAQLDECTELPGSVRPALQLVRPMPLPKALSRRRPAFCLEFFDKGFKPYRNF